MAAASRRIAVVVGGGMIGQRIVRQALRRGRPVTVLARDWVPEDRRSEHLGQKAALWR